MKFKKPEFWSNKYSIISLLLMPLSFILILINFFLKNKKSTKFKVPIICVSNREFTKQLAKTLKRPAIFPLPSFIAKLLFGQMAQETLLADLPVYSSRLKELDFELSYPDLAEALTHLIENG